MMRCLNDIVNINLVINIQIQGDNLSISMKMLPEDQYQRKCNKSNDKMSFKHLQIQHPEFSIRIPKPKRAQKDDKDIFFTKHQIQMKSKDQNKWFQQMIVKIFLAVQKMVNTRKQRAAAIAQILSYLLGQYQQNQKLLGQTKTVYDWEIDQLTEQVSDAQLGDFIIKMPNPDQLPQKFNRKYFYSLQRALPMQQTQEIQCVDLETAHHYYKEMFYIDTSKDTYLEQSQELAFLLGFYFLDIKTKVTKPENDPFFQSSKKLADLFQYYKVIKSRTEAEYLKVLQTKDLTQIQESLRELIHRRVIKRLQDLSNQKTQFSIFKQEVWNHLNKQLHSKTFRTLREGKALSFLANIKSISDVLMQFPSLMDTAIIAALQQRTNKKDGLRKLNKGGSIKKTISGTHYIHCMPEVYPQDVMTLLRRTLQYRLTRRGMLYVRSFLSSNQQFIYLIVKSSEPVLEFHAQKKHIMAEVELGSTDLFSFEPVDKYYRPLRVNKYIRDIEFARKYNLKVKPQPQDDANPKSVQSQIINIYKKAQKLNEDELRAKIIMDQEQADASYRWISKTLQIDYLSTSEQILTNVQNNQVITRDTWEVYYIYNKMIIQFTNRAKQLYEKQKSLVENNIGMLLRLMFLKAVDIANGAYRNHRERSKFFIPNSIGNFFSDGKILKTLWDELQMGVPSAFWSYVRTNKTERIWRKYEINQDKGRSKFFPAEKLFITNRIIEGCFNKSKCLAHFHIVDFFPSHDPYILKNIRIKPYLYSFLKFRDKQTSNPIAIYKEAMVIGQRHDPKYQQVNALSQVFSQYQSSYTASDFTKSCIQQRLQFKFTKITQFSSESVRYYCGEKIAFYFQFVRFLTMKALPISIIALAFQIILWVQQSDILRTGTSNLTEFNNVMLFIFTFMNIVWTTHAVEKWRAQQIRLGQAFGVNNLTSEDQARAQFVGSFRRDFINDELNHEYVPFWRNFLQSSLTLALGLTYMGFVVLIIMLIFTLKSVLFQGGYSQGTVTIIPSILIAITAIACNYIFTLLMGVIVRFQNHKTLSQYQNSLVSKSFLVTLVLRFYSVFIYAFFSSGLNIEFICRIRTGTEQIIYNCDYFVSDQLLWFVIIDLLTGVLSSVLPFFKFKLKEYLKVPPETEVKFNGNFFQAIDEFYEQQDQMETYMYNEEIDRSWQAYLSIMAKFTALALFAPALPFSYFMMFLGGIVSLHAGKFQVILLSRRSVPIKVKSINMWITIMEVLSVASIVINLLYMIYTRNVFTDNKPQVFFILLIIFLVFKYYLILQYEPEDDKMGRRNYIKTQRVLLGKGRDHTHVTPQQVNCDIVNVIYNDQRLRRKFPFIPKANVKTLPIKNLL